MYYYDKSLPYSEGMDNEDLSPEYVNTIANGKGLCSASRTETGYFCM